MSLKSRRGSHNLKFGGQTIPDARGSNSKRPVAMYSLCLVKFHFMCVVCKFLFSVTTVGE